MTAPDPSPTSEGRREWRCNAHLSKSCTPLMPHPGDYHCGYVDAAPVADPVDRPGDRVVVHRYDLEVILDDLQSGKHYDAEEAIERLLASAQEASR